MNGSLNFASLRALVKEIQRFGYPCHWCGRVTAFADSEGFHICSRDVSEQVKIGYDAMKVKYPSAGKVERNPNFFKKQTARRIARAKRLTLDELRLLVKRACFYEKGYAQAILDGKKLKAFAEHEIESLGHSAEQYIDDCR